MHKVITLAAAMIIATSAQANMISSSDSKPQELTEINQSLTLDKFDSNTGTLNTANLTLSGDAFSSLLLDNDSPSQTTFGYQSSAGIIFSSTLGLGIPGNFFAPTLELLLWQEAPTLGGDVDSDGNSGQNGGPDEQNFGDYLAHESIVLNVTAFINNLAMAGGGTFNIDCSSQVKQSFIGGGGNVQAKQTTKAGCGASIEYDFTELTPPVVSQSSAQVPEPAVLALMGLGLAGIGSRRHRCKKSA